MSFLTDLLTLKNWYNKTKMYSAIFLVIERLLTKSFCVAHVASLLFWVVIIVVIFVVVIQLLLCLLLLLLLLLSFLLLL